MRGEPKAIFALLALYHKEWRRMDLQTLYLQYLVLLCSRDKNTITKAFGYVGSISQFQVELVVERDSREFALYFRFFDKADSEVNQYNLSLSKASLSEAVLIWGIADQMTKLDVVVLSEVVARIHHTVVESVSDDLRRALPVGFQVALDRVFDRFDKDVLLEKVLNHRGLFDLYDLDVFFVKFEHLWNAEVFEPLKITNPQKFMAFIDGSCLLLKDAGLEEIFHRFAQYKQISYVTELKIMVEFICMLDDFRRTPPVLVLWWTLQKFGLVEVGDHIFDSEYFGPVTQILDDVLISSEIYVVETDMPTVSPKVSSTASRVELTEDEIVPKVQSDDDTAKLLLYLDTNETAAVG